MGLKLVAVRALTLFVALTFLHVAFSGLREDARIVTGGDPGNRVSLAAGRSFLVDSPSTARDLDRMLAVIGRNTSPGDSLFVGCATSDERITTTLSSITFCRSSSRRRSTWS